MSFLLEIIFEVLIYREEEINDLEAVVSMLSCGALQRSKNSYIEWIMCFSESERDHHYVGLIGKKILKKDWGNGRKYHKLKAEFVCVCVRVYVCVCLCEAFDIIAIIFKIYKKCQSPIKKGF